MWPAHRGRSRSPPGAERFADGQRPVFELASGGEQLDLGVPAGRSSQRHHRLQSGHPSPDDHHPAFEQCCRCPCMPATLRAQRFRRHPREVRISARYGSETASSTPCCKAPTHDHVLGHGRGGEAALTLILTSTARALSTPALTGLRSSSTISWWASTIALTRSSSSSKSVEVCLRPAPKAAQQGKDRQRADHLAPLLGAQRTDSHGHVLEQLRLRSPGPAGQHRAEHRIGDDPDQELHPTLDHALHDEASSSMPAAERASPICARGPRDLLSTRQPHAHRSEFGLVHDPGDPAPSGPPAPEPLGGLAGASRIGRPPASPARRSRSSPAGARFRPCRATAAPSRGPRQAPRTPHPRGRRGNAGGSRAGRERHRTWRITLPSALAASSG